jgi:hypothetical protein
MCVLCFGKEIFGGEFSFFHLISHKWNFHNNNFTSCVDKVSLLGCFCNLILNRRISKWVFSFPFALEKNSWREINDLSLMLRSVKWINHFHAAKVSEAFDIQRKWSKNSFRLIGNISFPEDFLWNVGVHLMRKVWDFPLRVTKISKLDKLETGESFRREISKGCSDFIFQLKLDARLAFRCLKKPVPTLTLFHSLLQAFSFFCIFLPLKFLVIFPFPFHFSRI